jgi:hypothetical protein
MDHRNCSVCNNPPNGNNTHGSCSLCQSSVYCGPACVSDDEQYHHYVCLAFKTFVDGTPRPTYQHRLALILPEGSSVPQFTWIACGYGAAYPELGMHLGDQSVAKYKGGETLYITEELKKANRGVQNFMYVRCVELTIRSHCAIDGSISNRCGIEVTNNNHKHDWKGPMIIMSRPVYPPSNRNIRDTYEDITTADFRVAVEYLLFYGRGVAETKAWEESHREHLFAIASAFANIIPNTRMRQAVQSLNEEMFSDVVNRSPPPARPRNRPPTIKVVRIQDSQYAQVEIGEDYNIFQSTPAVVSKRLKLPLVIQRLWTESPILSTSTTEGQEARLLHLVAGFNSRGFGLPGGQEWNLLPGQAIIVARQDKKPLNPLQLEALVDFHGLKLIPAMQALNEKIKDRSEGAKERARGNFVKNEISRERFEEFLKTYKQNKITAGDSCWADLVSPYSV